MKTKLGVMMILGMLAVGCGDESVEPTTDSSQSSELKAGKADKLGSGASASAATRPSETASDAAEGTDARPSDADSDAADSSSDADDGSDDTRPVADCSADECGPGLRAPIVQCDDGSLGGPVCERDEAGICGWSIRECPMEECKPEECGAAIRPPIVDCVDGTQGGPVCDRNNDAGVCEWRVRQCPAECDPRKCGDQPDWLLGCDGQDLHPVCLYDNTDSVDAVSCSWHLPACPSADLAD